MKEIKLNELLTLMGETLETALSDDKPMLIANIEEDLYYGYDESNCPTLNGMRVSSAELLNMVVKGMRHDKTGVLEIWVSRPVPSLTIMLCIGDDDDKMVAIPLNDNNPLYHLEEFLYTYHDFIPKERNWRTILKETNRCIFTYDYIEDIEVLWNGELDTLVVCRDLEEEG